MRLACYDDPAASWGRSLARVAQKRGHSAYLFADADEAEGDVAFVRMHNNPQSREHDRELHRVLSGRTDIGLVPAGRWYDWYDDKRAQAEDLAQWLPTTVIYEDAESALRALEAGAWEFPLVSKTSEGSASHNVRLVRNEKAARLEIEQVFNGPGIAARHGKRQRGYLLWQKFCRGNDYDFRVIAIGTERVILRRGNRPDVPFASGSDSEMPVSWPDAEAQRVLEFADAFFAAHGLTWCGIDVVLDGGLPVLLEVTASWPLRLFHLHRFVSGRPGADFWHVVVDELEAGRLGAV